jgi:hypothetical protein
MTKHLYRTAWISHLDHLLKTKPIDSPDLLYHFRSSVMTFALKKAKKVEFPFGALGE